MAYASYTDIEIRLGQTLSGDQRDACNALLCDAATMLDAYAPNATDEIKRLVSIRMVMRAIGTGDTGGIPMGATQGTMSGLGYSQSWTISGGANGELYLSKTERQMLGMGNSIGSYSPVQELAVKCK
jgi:hypothetical protein